MRSVSNKESKRQSVNRMINTFYGYEQLEKMGVTPAFIQQLIEKDDARQRLSELITLIDIKKYVDCPTDIPFGNYADKHGV